MYSVECTLIICKFTTVLITQSSTPLYIEFTDQDLVQTFELHRSAHDAMLSYQRLILLIFFTNKPLFGSHQDFRFFKHSSTLAAVFRSLSRNLEECYLQG